MTVRDMRPPDPITAEGIPLVFTSLLVILALLVIAGTYESWLMRSDFLSAARQQMLNDPRVRPEFGSDVKVRAAIGWKQDGAATVYAYVRGREAYGWARFHLVELGGSWEVASAELRDVSEDHVLKLASVSGIAPADRLHGQSRLYLVALGSSAASEVTDLAKFLWEECGVEA